MTVKELVDKFKEFPQDLPVGIMYDVHPDIDVHVATWVHSNYPYDKPDFDYVNIN